MNILNFLRKQLCPQQAEVFKFNMRESMRLVHSMEIRRIIIEAYPDAHIRIPDDYFTLLPRDEIVRWLNIDSLDKMRYIETVFDCDDFATESRCRMKRLSRLSNDNFLYAYCEGSTPAGYHAFNLVTCSDMEIIIIEPQNDDTRGWKKSDFKPDFIQF